MIVVYVCACRSLLQLAFPPPQSGGAKQLEEETSKLSKSLSTNKSTNPESLEIFM